MREVPRTYTVLCWHLGSAWAVRIPEARPRGIGARLSQVEAVARALVSTYAGDDTGAVAFTVQLMPDALSAGLAAAAAAREKAVRFPVQEMATRRRLARQLYVEGLEVADIAAALGVSSRRVRPCSASATRLPVPAEAALPLASVPAPRVPGNRDGVEIRECVGPAAVGHRRRVAAARPRPHPRSTASGTRPSSTAATRAFSRARSRSCGRASTSATPSWSPSRSPGSPGCARPSGRGPRTSPSSTCAASAPTRPASSPRGSKRLDEQGRRGPIPSVGSRNPCGRAGARSSGPSATCTRRC